MITPIPNVCAAGLFAYGAAGKTAPFMCAPSEIKTEEPDSFKAYYAKRMAAEQGLLWTAAACKMTTGSTSAGCSTPAEDASIDDLTTYLAKRKTAEQERARAHGGNRQGQGKIGELSSQQRVTGGAHSHAQLYIRRATVDDVRNIRSCNVACTPNEAYQPNYFVHHIQSWPQLQYVAEDPTKDEIVGYILSRIVEEERAHITSLAVLPSHRNLGLATRLVRAAEHEMLTTFDVASVSLYLRKSNHPAFRLYSTTLDFEVHAEKKEFYLDGEGAFDMRKALKSAATH